MWIQNDNLCIKILFSQIKKFLLNRQISLLIKHDNIFKIKTQTT